jgi:hypothetical protein
LGHEWIFRIKTADQRPGLLGADYPEVREYHGGRVSPFDFGMFAGWREAISFGAMCFFEQRSLGRIAMCTLPLLADRVC